MCITAFARAFLAVSMVAMSGATAAGAQDRSTLIGGRFGYEFESEERLFSATLTVPMTSRVGFYPSVDIYAPEKGSKIGFNGDVKIFFPKFVRFLYAGLGAGVISTTVGDSSSTSFGANLLMGLQANFGWMRPFVEGRAVSRDKTQFQIIGGINISRGSG
jgi:hypothetical protein